MRKHLFVYGLIAIVALAGCKGSDGGSCDGPKIQANSISGVTINNTQACGGDNDGDGPGGGADVTTPAPVIVPPIVVAPPGAAPLEQGRRSAR